MSGAPVWLASLSKHELGRPDRLKATGTWSPDEVRRGYERLCWALRGRGDPGKERLFRMNLTLCLHRAATVEEVAALPPGWHAADAGLAGGPVEVLWSKGVALTESCKPCLSPGKMVPDPSRPDLWLPLSCGRCKPCLARSFVEKYGRVPQEEELEQELCRVRSVV